MEFPGFSELVLSHMINIATTPKYGEYLKISSFPEPNLKTHDLETWYMYVIFGTWLLSS